MAELSAIAPPIPARLNLVLLAGAMAGSGAFLWAASQAAGAFELIACAVAFAFTNNTLFSLLHEAVHGIFHPRRGVNEAAGRLAAAFFPTGLSLQRAFHLTHHRNNRTELEQFDVLHEGDLRWLKLAQWYTILTGFYWLVAVAGALVYLLVPRALRLSALRRKDSQVATQTSSSAYLAALDDLDPFAARLEILFSFAVQAGLFLLLDLSLLGWASCYAAFALAWSGLQYADHAFSPLDRHEGAWNLRVDPVTRAFFLNYHFHRAHHQHPQTPWNALPALVDPAEPQPSFLRVWWLMWRGPRALEAFPSRESLLRERPQGGQGWAAKLREAVTVEFLCLLDMARFTRRHRRYGLIALLILVASVPRWRRTRVLRTGFTFLQHVDDLLDGDRPSAKEPLEVVAEVRAAIASQRFGGGDLHHLARAFEADLREAGGEPAVAKALALIACMERDRHRVREQLLLSRDELRDHLRETFSLSIDLLMIAARADLRADDVPELLEAFGWCSTVRDLEEDLEAGLVNVPAEVVAAARTEGLATLTHQDLTASPPVRAWLAAERTRAIALLVETDRRLAGLGKRQGVRVLKLFVRSIWRYTRR